MASTWVDDFSALQGGGKGGLVKKPVSRKEHIEAELKLLEWHKLANEAAIKVERLAITVSRVILLCRRLPYYRRKM
jgi:hypothetical protein